MAEERLVPQGGYNLEVNEIVACFTYWKIELLCVFSEKKKNVDLIFNMFKSL